MKSPLYIWCTYDGETLYEESSVYMGVHTMGRPCMKSPLLYMVYIRWGDLV